MLRSRRWLLLLILAGLIGLIAGAAVGWRWVTIQEVAAPDSQARFDEALRRVEARPPLVQIDSSGQLTRLQTSRPREPRPARLYVMAFDAGQSRLVRADVPLWFLKVKGPAARFALGGTGLDLEKLGLTASDLEEAGAGVVIDEHATNGNRLLAWTE